MARKIKMRVVFEISRIVRVDPADADDEAVENAADEIAKEVEEESENGNVADLCFARPVNPPKKKPAPKKTKRARRPARQTTAHYGAPGSGSFATPKYTP